MKSIVSFVGTVAAIVAFAGLDAALAQDHGSGRHLVLQSRSPAAKRPAASKATGAGRSVPANGPFYNRSIHQSAGDRDSRGLPKYCPNKNC